MNPGSRVTKPVSLKRLAIWTPSLPADADTRGNCSSLSSTVNVAGLRFASDIEKLPPAQHWILETESIADRWPEPMRKVPVPNLTNPLDDGLLHSPAHPVRSAPPAHGWLRVHRRKIGRAHV